MDEHNKNLPTQEQLVGLASDLDRLRPNRDRKDNTYFDWIVQDLGRGDLSSARSNWVKDNLYEKFGVEAPWEKLKRELATNTE